MSSNFVATEIVCSDFGAKRIKSVIVSTLSLHDALPICSPFFIVQLSHPYMTTGKTIALTRRTFVGKVMSLLFNMLSGLEEAQAGIKIAGRNISNLRYADDTTLMAESEEELKSLLMMVKEENEKVGLKLNIKRN